MRWNAALVLAGPYLFGTAAVLDRFLAFPSTAGALVRPMIVVWLLVTAGILILRAVTRSWTWAAIGSSIFILFTLRAILPAAVLATFAAWWLLLWLLRRSTNRPPAPPSTVAVVARAAAIVALVMAVIPGASAVATLASAPSSVASEPPDLGGSHRPSIFILLLDGYPRADTLTDTFGVDTSDFLAQLEALDFVVADEARSNYSSTWLTLATMLNGEYVNTVLDGQTPPEAPGGQVRWLHWLIENASMPDALRDHGYVIRSIPPAITTTAVTSADEVLDGGHLSDLEFNLLWASPWTYLVADEVERFSQSDHRARVIDALDTTVRLAAQRTGPQFALTHIHSPHAPFVLTPEGGDPVSLPECFPATCAMWGATLDELQMTHHEYASALADQVSSLNERVLATIEGVIRADPEAVIVVLSDHGTRYSPADEDEHLRVLFAARTPGAEPFGRAEHPVNVFRNLFAAYFDADLAPLPYRGWHADWHYPLQVTTADDSR